MDLQTISLPVKNISCDSCEKVISRLLGRFPHARMESISKDAKTLTLSCTPESVSDIKGKLSEYGYLNEGTVPGFSPVWIVRQILEGKSAFRAENVFLTRVIAAFIVLFVLAVVQQFVLFNNISGGEKMWPVLALVPFGIALNAGALWHARLLREQFTCNVGMMVGMTLGMMSGFMLGAVIGATNGMFMGTVSGMLVGIVTGAYAGKYAGIMGVMEGMMAGLMAGTMGAMLSVMLISDHLVLFLYLLFGFCAIVLAGMSYLVYREAGPLLDENLVPSLSFLVFWGIIVMLGITALILQGPRSISAWSVL